MSDRQPAPYGLKSLLECMSRAVILEQPDDIPGFLSKYMEEMIQFIGTEEMRDTKEVAFDYEEQWERAVLQKTLKAPEEPPSPLSSESITPTASFSVSPRVSSDRLPTINNRVGLTHGEISPSVQRQVPVPPPPRMGRDTSQAKASRPSAVLVLPPIQQAAPSKQTQGRKSTTGRCNRFTCRLKDCCHHNKPKVGECAFDSESPPLRRTRDQELKRLLAAPSKPDIQFPYRPKGGFITDRELEPMRTGARPVSNKPCPTSFDGGGTSRTVSQFVHCRQDTTYSRQGAEVVHCADTSLEYSVHTADSVHVIRYTYTHVQGGKHPPLSACSSMTPNLSKDQRESRNGSPYDSLRNASAMGRTPSSRQSSWKQF